jgi:TonB family protein
MTLPIKDSAALLSNPVTPGTTSPNSENIPGARPNPVCLEVGVTVRSLPTPGSSTSPIREEGRTVIVFDNGAVLRLPTSLPPGQSVILSNSGRDVVCKVSEGRNLPNVKGYVEVEFLEPVNDFWQVHQDSQPVANVPTPPPPASPAIAQRSAPAPIPVPVAAPREIAAKAPLEKHENSPPAKGPTFEDVPGLLSAPHPPAVREPKKEPARSIAMARIDNELTSSLNEPAESVPRVASLSSNPEHAAHKSTAPALPDLFAVSTHGPAATGDLLNKGLLASSETGAPSGALSRRVPMILGGAVLLLALAGGAFYFLRPKPETAPTGDPVVASQRSSTEHPAANSTPAFPALGSPASQEPQPGSMASPAAQPVAAVAPVAAAVEIPTTPNSSATRKLEKNTSAAQQPERPSVRAEAIPSLKMSVPSAPRRNLSNQTENAPAAEIAPAAGVAGAPSASLLSAAARTSNPPAPPPGGSLSFPSANPALPMSPASTATTTREAKLISSTRATYPAAAKESHVQGSVAIFASIDPKGNVSEVKALSGPMILRQAAIEAVKQWKYSPALLNGKPAPAEVTINVDFRLN